jgi:hypothetical protein
VAVTAAISVVGYTVSAFGSSQQAAFAAVLSAQLYVPASSVQITSVSAATNAAGRHRRLHQAASGVTVAFTVTATSSTAANNLAASITNMAVSPSFVAALQSGGLPAASATALATAPSVPATSYYNPPPSGGGGGYPGQYYGPTPFPNSYTPNSNYYASASPPPSSGAGVGVAVGIVVPLVVGCFAVCRVIGRRRQAAAAQQQAAAQVAAAQVQPQHVQMLQRQAQPVQQLPQWQPQQAVQPLQPLQPLPLQPLPQQQAQHAPIQMVAATVSTTE